MKTSERRSGRSRHGLARQKLRREAERASRTSVVALGRWARRQQRSLSRVALYLGLPVSTLKSWDRRWRFEQLDLHARGRPGMALDREDRREVLALMDLLGPHTGLPTLRKVFPAAARAELVDLQHRYRAAYRRRHGMLMHVLRWTRPGAVWAIDFTVPPCRIDGVYDRVLVLRDLASDYQLAALPTVGESVPYVIDLLRAQFAWQGAPLVIKSDNGSAFTSDAVRWLLTRHGVLALFSPPVTPRYNGSVEAGIGRLKVRAHYASARAGRVTSWSCDDLEAACGQANQTTRQGGPTPEETWHNRIHIPDGERALFQQAYLEYREKERIRRGLTEPITRRAVASLDRIALGRALVEAGYLLVRRRRVPPPIIPKNRSRIS